MTGSTKVHSTMPRTSVFIGINVAKLMPVERLSYAVLNVPPALHVTRHVMTSKKSDVTGWIRRLKFVTDAPKRSPDAQ